MNESDIDLDASDQDPRTVQRRAALKAALGGAVAAGTFVAPKVTGLSITPDYAAAGTVCSGSPPTVTWNTGNDAPTWKKCNGSCCSGSKRGRLCFAANAANCGCSWCDFTSGCTGSAASTLNIAKPGGGNVSLNFSISGGPGQGAGGNWTNNGDVHFTIAGMGGRVNSCNVAVNGNCTATGINWHMTNAPRNNNDMPDYTNEAGQITTSWSKNFTTNATENRHVMDCKGWDPTNNTHNANLTGVVQIAMTCTCSP